MSVSRLQGQTQVQGLTWGTHPGTDAPELSLVSAGWCMWAPAMGCCLQPHSICCHTTFALLWHVRPLHP